MEQYLSKLAIGNSLNTKGLLSPSQPKNKYKKWREYLCKDVTCLKQKTLNANGWKFSDGNSAFFRVPQ